MEPLATYAAECIECGLASYVRCYYCQEAVCSDHKYNGLCLLCAPRTPICDQCMAICDRNPDLDDWQDFHQSPDDATSASGSQISTTWQDFNQSPDNATLPSGSHEEFFQRWRDQVENLWATGASQEERCQAWRQQVEVFWATGPLARRQTAQIQEPPVPAQSSDDAPTWQEFPAQSSERPMVSYCCVLCGHCFDDYEVSDSVVLECFECGGDCAELQE